MGKVRRQSVNIIETMASNDDSSSDKGSDCQPPPCPPLRRTSPRHKTPPPTQPRTAPPAGRGGTGRGGRGGAGRGRGTGRGGGAGRGRAASSGAAAAKKKSRTSNFRAAELDIMLDFIEDVLPIGGQEWEKVEALHLERFPDSKRTAHSIKRKFQDLYRVRMPTGDPDIPAPVKRAKRIQKAICQRSDAEAEVVVDEEALGFEDEEVQLQGGDTQMSQGTVPGSAAVSIRRGATFSPHGRRGTTNDFNQLKDMMMMSLMQKMNSQPSEEELRRQKKERRQERQEQQQNRMMQQMMMAMMEHQNQVP